MSAQASLLHFVVSPQSFLSTVLRYEYRLTILAYTIISCALYYGLFKAPVDTTQGEVYRIIYIHVPLALLSLLIYCLLGACSILTCVWSLKSSDICATACSVLGSMITLLTLITGSIWAKPTWGTWWFWDARLTSECVLLCMYVSFLCMRFASTNQKACMFNSAVIGCVGLINIPIVHYSVNWWYTLHQGSSILHFAKPTMPADMLYPLLGSILGFSILSAVLLLQTMQRIYTTRQTIPAPHGKSAA